MKRVMLGSVALACVLFAGACARSDPVEDDRHGSLTGDLGTPGGDEPTRDDPGG